MIDWPTCEATERHPQRCGGAWVFRGTRVPVSSLFENLGACLPITEYVEAFEGVTIEQVRDVLEHAARSLIACDWANPNAELHRRLAEGDVEDALAWLNGAQHT